MKIAVSKTREQFPLSRKKIIKKTTSLIWGLTFFLLILIVGGLLILSWDNENFFSKYIGMALFYWVLFMIFITIVNYIYQRWYFAVYYYDLNEDYIVIKKGPITPKEITIPYERIQDVYVDQDIFDRIFGLYDVHLSSATVSSGIEAHIDGVEKQAAEGLRAKLLQTVQQKISKK